MLLLRVWACLLVTWCWCLEQPRAILRPGFSQPSRILSCALQLSQMHFGCVGLDLSWVESLSRSTRPKIFVEDACSLAKSLPHSARFVQAATWRLQCRGCRQPLVAISDCLVGPVDQCSHFSVDFRWFDWYRLIRFGHAAYPIHWGQDSG